MLSLKDKASSSLTYRPEIDGLRAIAVIAVIWSHAELWGAPGGFSGVDIFFVISGFLITSLITNEMRQQKFSISNFYERRARRILPALYLVMASTFVMAYFLLSPAELRRMATSDLFVLGFVSNIHFWWKYDYFDGASNLIPMLHTWSLAVEEQFYVLFPFLLFLLRKRSSAQILFWLVPLAALSFASIYLWRAVDSTGPFYWLPTRAWELLAGAMCVFVPTNKLPTNGAAQGLSILGLIAIFGTIAFLPETVAWPSILTLVPVIGTALVVLATRKGTIVHQLLSAKPMVGLGLISYSAYLWHFPLLAMARHLSDGRGLPLSFRLVAVALSLFAAFLTWKFVEQPWRNRDHVWFGSGKFALGLALALTVGLATLSVWGKQSGGWPSRLSGDYYLRLRHNTGIGDQCGQGIQPGNPAICQTGSNPNLVLWGDSFAMHLFTAIQTANKDVQLMQMTYSACTPIPGYITENPGFSKRLLSGCMAHNENSLKFLTESNRDATVVMSTAFSGYYDDQVPIIDRSGKNLRGTFDLNGQFIRVIQQLKAIGHRVIVVSPLPIAKYDMQQCQLYRIRLGEPDEFCNFPLAEAQAKRIGESELMNEVSRITDVVRLDEIVCPDGVCRTYQGGVMIYRDAAHLSYEGSEWLGRQPQFRVFFAKTP